MKFKLFFAFLPLCGLTLFGCGDGSDKAGAEGADSIAQDGPLTEQQAQVRLIDLFNKISSDMDEIKILESRLSSGSTDGMSPQQIQIDIQTLQAELDTRKQEIEQLKAQLSKSVTENARLLKMIDNLEAQVATYESTIADLSNQLSEAHVEIANLSGTVETLNHAVDSVSTQLGQAKEQAEIITQQNVALEQEANRCYYVIGSKAELKKHNIVESGFLKKTKVTKDFVGNSYFTVADRRSLLHIPTHSKKAKVLSSQPVDTYTITIDDAGNKVVNIINPTRFWGTMNYLVIQVD